MVAACLRSVAVVVLPRGEYPGYAAEQHPLATKQDLTFGSRPIGLPPALTTVAAAAEHPGSAVVGLGQHVTVVRTDDHHTAAVPGRLEQGHQGADVSDPEFLGKGALAEVVVDGVDDHAHDSGALGPRASSTSADSDSPAGPARRFWWKNTAGRPSRRMAALPSNCARSWS